MIVLPYVVAILTGIAVSALSLSLPARRSSLVFLCSTGIVVGLILYGVMYSLVSLLFPGLHPYRFPAEIALCASLLALAFHKGVHHKMLALHRSPVASPFGFVDYAFWIFFAVAISVEVLDSMIVPYGAWDAIAMWNLKARFLALSDGSVARLMQKGYGHSDYPLLLPSINAGIFQDGQSLSTLVPIATMNLLFLSLAGMLVGAVSLMSHRYAGYLAGGMLLANGLARSLFLTQYADPLLATLLLLASALLILRARFHPAGQTDHIVLGMAMGGLIFTKNEGYVIFLALTVSYALSCLWPSPGNRPTRRAFLLWSAGLAPYMLALLVFKVFYPAENDLTAGLTSSVPRLADPARYAMILGGWYRAATNPDFGSWLLFLLVLFPFVFRIAPTYRSVLVLTAPTLLILLGCYSLVYLVTPHDLAWHLRTSVERLFFHGLPTFYLLVFGITEFASFRSREETAPGKESTASEGP